MEIRRLYTGQLNALTEADGKKLRANSIIYFQTVSDKSGLILENPR